MSKVKLNVVRAGLASAFLLGASSGQSAPGEISTIPLFLGNQVPPNVLFVLDDSGSMENEVLTRAGAPNSDKAGVAAFNGNLDMTPSLGNEDEFLEHCLGFNVLAFDPSREYDPWLGFGNVDISVENPSAPSFPAGIDHTGSTSTAYNSAGGGNGGDAPRGGAALGLNGTTNSPVGYVPWNDADGDNEFDPGECNIDQIVEAGNTEELEASGFVTFQSMSSEMQQQYANWYTYYRKRRFLLTDPMLEIAETADIRAGMATINSDSSVGFEIVDLNDGNNRQLMQQRLLVLGQNAGTPLRRPLENAGRYYEGLSLNGASGFVNAGNNPVSPILPADQGGFCQQNFTMLMTDGQSNEGGNGPTNTIGNADGNNNSLFDGGSYGDSFSNTLGDIAMHFYERDLLPNDTAYPDAVLSNRDNNELSDANGLEINPAQHMETYTIAFGVTGNISGVDSSIGEGTVDANAITWPVTTTPSFYQNQGGAGSIDDLLHAAYNGRGDFLSALDPEGLEQGLQEIVSSILASTQGAASGVGFNSTNTSDENILYQATFFPEEWSGTVEAFQLLEDGSLSDVAVFDAGELLATRVAAEGHTSRQIFTYNGTTGVPFAFPENAANPTATELSQTQIDDLLADVTGDEQEFGENIVAFLRGDSSLANDEMFRDRGTPAGISGQVSSVTDPNVLGDIASSSPQVVAIPNEGFPEAIATSSYQAFVDANLERTPMVYVGANDGMVHGFNADDGQEVFAYIPSFLFSDDDGEGLHFLADPNYTHIPYIDGTPTAGDVFVGDAWRTYLVGGANRGGMGVYVLDVTNPNDISEATAAATVVKEFTNPNLGFTFSRPQIALLNDGRWAAVFGNGYTETTGDGRARLFILYLDGASPEFREIDTGVGSLVGGSCLSGGSDCNGLSTTQIVDLTGNFVIDRVYAGDLQGNMWAFDLSSDNPNEWGIAHQNGSGNPEPLFQACSTDPCTVASRQPITTEPAVVGHETQISPLTAPNAFVLFGTGQLVAEADIDNIAPQTFYGVWDAGTANGGITRDQLTEQDIFIDTATGERSLTDNDVNYSIGAPVNLGWFIELPDSGERSVIPPLVSGEVVLFPTSIPNDEACGNGGSGFFMAADIFDGSITPFNVFENDGQAGVFLAEGLPVGFGLEDGAQVRESDGDNTNIDLTVTADRPTARSNWLIVR